MDGRRYPLDNTDLRNEDDNKERFTREVFERKDDAPAAEFYNDWILENLG